jgi:hypothetical protein
MADQLTLITPPDLPDRRHQRRHDWRLDEQTRAAGRKGIEAARQALQDAARRAAA